MEEAERSVLHVLPHAGGGGDTYVDVLDGMPGYRFTRVYLAPSRTPGIAPLARGFVDVVRCSRTHDLLHLHGEVVGGLLLPLLFARPSVVTLHGLHLLRRVAGAKRRVAELNLRAVVRAADRTICVSDAERRALLAAIGESLARRTNVVHNGARVPRGASPGEREDVRAELGLAASDVVGIWVGSLDERRDPVAVVRAAERTSTSLLVVGDGPLRAQVELAAERHVRVLGHRDDVPRLLDAADFFVLMSVREGFSFALLEAMTHGLPPIVADVAENLEAIDRSGLAVPYGDADAVAAAFHRLVQDGTERAVLGEQARRRAIDVFGVDKMIARTRAIYEEVLAEDRSRSV
jgi:glycosyltransferase involved in cell wall biosynthesis